MTLRLLISLPPTQRFVRFSRESILATTLALALLLLPALTPAQQQGTTSATASAACLRMSAACRTSPSLPPASSARAP